MSEQQMILYTNYLLHSKLDYKQYQYDGVKWCVNNETRTDSPGNVHGGFIADEMGLGKTILMIGTFIANYMPRTLIVLPPILIDQWYLQIYKTTGHKAIIFHGANKKNITLDQLNNSTIVLTTYATLSSTLSSTFKKSGAKSGGGGSVCGAGGAGVGGAGGGAAGGAGGGGREEIKKAKKEAKKEAKRQAKKEEKEGKVPLFVSDNLLHHVEWNRVVFDEAHHLRNKKTSRYVAAKALKTKIRWLVSGTPIQNKRDDFYNLCSMIGLPASLYADSSNILTIARSFILKRTKQQVGILIPDRLIENNITPWKNSLEHELTQEIHTKLSFFGTKNTIHNRIDMGSEPGQYLTLILKARQMCILPSLTISTLKMLEDDTENVNYYNEVYRHSSKLDNVVETILKKKGNGNGKLIFCHFRGEIDSIKKRLIDGGMEKVVTFDGRVKNSQRNNILCEKNEALILQIQTGCEGLNLQENYSEIYFVSPHWNPAVEEQAIARCHRIGQTKEVFVERFEMSKFYEEKGANCVIDEEEEKGRVVGNITIDNYVTRVQNKKRNIADEIMNTNFS